MANNHPAGLRLKEALRWLKTNKNMEQKDVAVIMGTSETTVSRNIRAALDGRPNADFILKLSEATGVSFSLQYIVNGTGTLVVQQKETELTPASPATDNLLELHAQMIRHVDDLRQELHQELLAIRQLKDELRATLAELKSATTYEYGMAAESH